MIWITNLLKTKGVLRPDIHQNPNKIFIKLPIYLLDFGLNCLKILLLFAFLENEKIQYQNNEKRDYAEQDDQLSGFEAHLG